MVSIYGNRVEWVVGMTAILSGMVFLLFLRARTELGRNWHAVRRHVRRKVVSMLLKALCFHAGVFAFTLTQFGDPLWNPTKCVVLCWL